VEEEAMSIGMASMSNAEENIDGLSGGDPPTPVLSPSPPPPLEKKKRGRPKSADPLKNGSTKVGGRNVLPKKRGRKPKALLMLPSPLSPSSELSACTPPHNPVHFDMNGDEFFDTSNNDILNYDDEIFNDIDNLGGITPFHTHTTSSLDDEINSDETLALPHMCGNGSGSGESLKLRLKVPGMHMIPPLMGGIHKKRGRKPKKPSKLSMREDSGNISSGSSEKRKYTKRKHSKDAEDTSNLRRSARPPQASRAFDDHYLL